MNEGSAVGKKAKGTRREVKIICILSFYDYYTFI